MKRFALPFLLMFILVACAPSQSSPVFEAISTPTDGPARLPTLIPNEDDNSELARIDEQGAVVIEVIPLNLGTPSDTLEFDVAMNTHSVDLGMDLATLSMLTTDTGITVQASKWDAIPGGHHVEGTLIFPSSQAGMPILEGASRLTLTIVNVDADSRIFEWELE